MGLRSSLLFRGYSVGGNCPKEMRMVKFSQIEANAVTCYCFVADRVRFLNTFSGIEIRPMATASLSPWISVLLFLSHLRCKPFSLSLFLLNSPPEMAFGFGAFAPKDQPGKAFKRTHSTENVEEPRVTG